MPTPHEEQIHLIVDRFNGEQPQSDQRPRDATDPVETGPRPGEGRPYETVEYLYRRGHILVREEYVDRVSDLITPEQGYRRAPRVRRVIPGVSLLEVQDRGTMEALGIVRNGTTRRGVAVGGLGRGIATLDHVVSISGNPIHCPATEPDPLPAGSAPDPGPTADRAAGEGVRVVVVDTGLDPKAAETHSWMAGVTGDDDLAIHSPDLGPYAGHGTFIAGVVRSVAPRAEVIVRRVFDQVGATFESDLVRTLDDVLEKDYPDVISMSAGCWTFDATGLLGLRVFYETRLRHHKGVVLVTAAGNDGDRRPFWPAAAPWTVSVGALATNYRGRASFSNFGGWVDVYAPGQDLVNAFPVGTYAYNEPPRKGQKADFYGMARWSGTSFATPVVAGLVAARMSHTGENGQDAAAALLKKAQAQAQPGVGAVLMPE
jgi:Subtilase family